MQNVIDRPEGALQHQDTLMRQVADLAATHLDDDRLAELIKKLVSAMVLRADEAPTGQEIARRHSRIQSLIKRL